MSEPNPRIGPDKPLAGPPRFSHAGGNETRVAKKVIAFLVILGLGGTIGFLLAFFPPVLLFGVVAGIASVALVLARPFWGLLLYAAVFILRPAEMMPVLAGLHLERVVGGMTVVALFLEMYRKEGKLFIDGSRQTVLFGALILVAYLTVPFSYWPGRSMTLVINLLKVLAFYLMIVQLVNSRARLRIFMGVFLSLIVYLGVTTLHAYYTGNLKFAQGIERALGTTSAGGDPNTLGGTLGSSVGLLVLIAATLIGFRRKLLLWVGAVLLIWPMALTGSRSSLLGFLTALVVLWTFSRRKVLMAGLAAALLIGAFAVLPEQYKTRYATMTEDEIDASSQGRLLAWRRGMLMVIDRPLLGVGIGCFGVAHAEAYSSEGHKTWLESHSLYVQVPAETGIMGTIAFFWFLIEAFQVNRRLRRKLLEDRPGWKFEIAVLDGIWTAFLFLLVFSIFGHTMYRYTWYIFAAVGVAIYRLNADLPLDEEVVAPDAERLPPPVVAS